MGAKSTTGREEKDYRRKGANWIGFGGMERTNLETPGGIDDMDRNLIYTQEL